MQQTKANDPVNHPAHYTAGGIECIDAISAALSSHKDPMQAWLTGQIIKYLWRWPMKNGKEDLEKARFYLDRLIQSIAAPNFQARVHDSDGEIIAETKATEGEAQK